MKDTVEVDFNVSRHLEVELAASDWNLMVHSGTCQFISNVSIACHVYFNALTFFIGFSSLFSMSKRMDNSCIFI